MKPRWVSSPTRSFAAIIKTTVDEIPDLEPNCTGDPHKLGGSIARVVGLAQHAQPGGEYVFEVRIVDAPSLPAATARFAVAIPPDGDSR